MATCGYTILDTDGEQQPCDRPATGWRWYQDVGDHEDLLEPACDWHANEGGRRIHDAEAERDRARTLAVALEQEVAALTGAVEELADEWEADAKHMPYDGREAHENDLLAGSIVPALRRAVEQGRREAGL